MRDFVHHPFIEWVVTIAAVAGGIIALKFASGYLPDGGFVGAVKQIIQTV